MKNILKNKNLLATYVGLFLLSAGISWLFFSSSSSVGGVSGDLVSAREKIAELPKTEECPLNGGMFTEVEKDIWDTRRPLAVVVENHVDARPLSGLSRADVVYEAVAEGGITRFLGVFHCAAATEDFRIAVVRSARVYFIKWAAEYGSNPLFMHWGGANNFCQNCPGGVKPEGDIHPKVDAYALLNDLGWVNGLYGNDLDGARNFAAPALVKMPERTGKVVASEHQPTAFVDLTFQKAKERGWEYESSKGVAWDSNFEAWSFVDDQPQTNPKASRISFGFWSGTPDFDVNWNYDSSTNSYLRSQGGRPFTDYEFENAQVVAKNIVIQFVDEDGPMDNEKHYYYENIGTGDAIVFQNGDVIEGTWQKLNIEDRTKFYDNSGKEISFVRGPIWIEAVPSGNNINY